MKQIFPFLLFINLNTALGSIFKKCDLSKPQSLKARSFDRCSQNQLDTFYKNINAGPIIPDGDFNGKVQLPNSTIFEKILSILPIDLNEAEEFYLERIWKGKVFYRENSNEAILFNKIVKNKLMFPAHVFYGQSLFDPTKLSIVIDYRNNQDIDGYNPNVDWLANTQGVAIRDEMRKVNERLYLGRAYVRGKFLLNFALESAD
ncbi:MAG: hypothetical protein R3A80_13935 [Bdellovibrionota bacterium]